MASTNTALEYRTFPEPMRLSLEHEVADLPDRLEACAENGRVVDIGCGDGRGYASLRHWDGLQGYVGVDVDERRIERARERFSSSDAEFVHAKAHMVSFSEFDVALCLWNTWSTMEQREPTVAALDGAVDLFYVSLVARGNLEARLTYYEEHGYEEEELDIDRETERITSDDFWGTSRAYASADLQRIEERFDDLSLLDQGNHEQYLLWGVYT